jgi:D-alanyl-D-alanine carboxypeptidase/D-alanyl-D-alanine-endopeptidase (penicillin-binding protein 4)
MATALVLFSVMATPAIAAGTTTTVGVGSTGTTGTSSTGGETPVLSARRLPGLLAAHKADAQLQAALQPILSQATPTTCLTVSAEGRLVASSNGDLPVMPASTEKLLTATAVLDRLGPDTILTTAAVSASAPSDGVVDGDLFVVGAGDPLLATTGYVSTFEEPNEPYNDYAKLADNIKAAGISEIRGNVVGDESHFDAQRYLPSWPKRYITQSEVGPLGALMVNDGFTGLSANPDAPATVRHPGDPAPLAAETLISLLRSRGVQVDGTPSTGIAPSGATTVASLDSKSMSVNVSEMLQRSDNTTAEVLAKDLDTLGGGQGTTAGGAQVVHDTLDHLGLPTQGSVTVDGSGLDGGNRVTCDLLVAALDHQGAHSALADDLPVAGKVGTLRKRMRGTPAEGKIRAKTGTLNDVGALAGFATTASGEDLTFAFVVNGTLASSQALGDELGVALAQYGAGIALDQIGPRPAGS